MIMSKPTQECIVWNYRGVPLILGGGCREDAYLYQLSDYDEQSFSNSVFGDLSIPEPPDDEVVPDVLSEEFCVFTCIDCNEVFNAEFSLMRCVDCMRGFVNPRCDTFPQHTPREGWEEFYGDRDVAYVSTVAGEGGVQAAKVHDKPSRFVRKINDEAMDLLFPNWHTVGRDLNGPQMPYQRSSDKAALLKSKGSMLMGLASLVVPTSKSSRKKVVTLYSQVVGLRKQFRVPKMPAWRWVMRAFHNWSAITSTNAEAALAQHLIDLRPNESLTAMQTMPYILAAGLAMEFRMKNPNPTRNRAMVRAAHDFFDEKILHLRDITRLDHVDALHIFAVLCFVPSESELKAMAIFASHPVQERIVIYNTPRSTWVSPSWKWWLGYYRSVRVVPPD